jgi:hypothetical protein
MSDTYFSMDDNILSAAKAAPINPPMFSNRIRYENHIFDTTLDEELFSFQINFVNANERLDLKFLATSDIDGDGFFITTASSTVTITIVDLGTTNTVFTEIFENSIGLNEETVTVYNSGKVSFIFADNVDYRIDVRILGSVDAGVPSPIYDQKIVLSNTLEPQEFQNLGYFNNDSQTVNNLRGKQFKFAYRFIYDDKERSLFSPFSEVLVPNDEEFVGGFISDNQSINNRIDFVLETGSQIVERIEIAVQIGELGAWKSYQILDKAVELIGNDTTTTFRFSNDRVSIPLSDLVVNQSSNILPQLAETQEFLPTNQISYGRITEGFDNVELDIDLNITFNPYSYVSGLISFNSRTETVDYRGTADYVVSYTVLTLPEREYRDDTYVVIVEKNNGEVVSIEAPDDWSVIVDYPSLVLKELVAELELQAIHSSATVPWTWIAPGGQAEHKFPDDNSTVSPTATASEIWFPILFRNTATGDITFNLNSASGAVVRLDVDTSDKFRTFKHGLYKVGLKYSDKFGRKSSTQTNDNLSIFVQDSDSELEFLNPIKYITYDIKHVPPIWAYSYQMVVTRNLSESTSFQWTIDSVQKVTRVGIDYVLVGINSSILGVRDFVPKFSLEPYTFVDGDQLRRIGIFDNTDQYWNPINDTNYYDILGVEFDTPELRKEYAYNQIDAEFKFQDVEVVDSTGQVIFRDNSQKIIIQINEDVSPDTIVEKFQVGTLIEILTPANETEDSFYFDIGDSFKISDPGTSDRAHEGSISNQSSVNPSGFPAKGVLTEGDYVWKIRYNIFRGIDFPSLGKEVSDFYTSRAISYGKVSVENLDAEQNIFNIIRHSGKYFDNTNINDLNAFKSEDYVVLDDRFGNITRTIQIGDALKVYQFKKSTSIYIGKSFIKQGDGTDQVMTVDRTFGVVNPSALDYGCSNPESVLRNERYVYFYDVLSGSFIRDAANGLEAISENLMNNYFKLKSQALIASGLDNIRVITGYDEELNMALVTFIDSVNSDNTETLGFHEPSNRWISFFSFIPDIYSDSSNMLFTVKGGAIYKHNSNSVDRCTFYGVKFPRQLKLYINENLDTPKLFYSISIHTNQVGWSLPEIKIAPNANISRGMFSRVQSSNFVFQDGVLYADFKRNMLTTSAIQSVIDLVSGEQLRGEVLDVTLSESTNDETVLYEVDVVFTKA